MKWRLILSFLVTFAAGTIVGGMTSLHFARSFFFSPPDPKQMEEKILKDLRSELKLTSEQVEVIRPIIVRTTTEAAAYHRAIFTRSGELFRQSDEEISAHLNAEQKIHFEKLKKRRPHPKEP